MRQFLVPSMLAILAAVILTAPVPANAADQTAVLTACERTKGCTYQGNGDGGAVGCSPKICFKCDGKECHAVTKTAQGTLKPIRGDVLKGLTASTGNTSKGKAGLSDISITKQTDKASSNLSSKNSSNGNKMTTPPSAGILGSSGSGVPSHSSGLTGQSNKPKEK